VSRKDALLLAFALLGSILAWVLASRCLSGGTPAPDAPAARSIPPA
jgi:hypothetical protein